LFSTFRRNLTPKDPDIRTCETKLAIPRRTA